MVYKYLIIFLLIFSLAGFSGSGKHSEGFEASNTLPEALDRFTAHAQKIYEDCALSGEGLDFDIFMKGLTGFYNMQRNEMLSTEKEVLTIIDFQKSSSAKRLWVIDLKNRKVLFNTLVSHGKNTGQDMALQFSNTPGSNMSSLGFYCTGNTYTGKHGLSLVLEGIDSGMNCNAASRAVVMHGADYVSEDFVKCNGRLGRSQGCPALPMDLHNDIISEIKDKTCLFIYHPAMGSSAYLDMQSAAEFLMHNKFNALNIDLK